MTGGTGIKGGAGDDMVSLLTIVSLARCLLGDELQRKTYCGQRSGVFARIVVVTSLDSGFLGTPQPPSIPQPVV